MSGRDELVLDPRVNVGWAFKDSHLGCDRQTLPYVQHFLLSVLSSEVIQTFHRREFCVINPDFCSISGT